MSKKEYECTAKDIVNFSIRKMKKFWSLHIIMLLILLSIFGVGCIITHNWNEIYEVLLKFVVSVTMIQSFIPIEPWYYGLNGVAWYLSTLVLFYILFIPVYKVVKKLSVKNCIKVMCGGIILHFAVIVLLQNIEFFSYWTYIFPPFRAIEFIIGVLLGNIFVNREGNNINEKLATVEEILVIAVFLIDRILCQYTTFYAVPHNYQSVVGVIIAIMIVYVFSKSQGIISKWLCNKVNVYLGEISFEIFMIHTTILEIWYFLFSKFMGDVWKMPFVAIVTFLLAVAYHNKLWKKCRIYR